MVLGITLGFRVWWHVIIIMNDTIAFLLAFQNVEMKFVLTR